MTDPARLTETAYVRTENLTLIRAIEELMRMVLPGQDYGVDPDGYKAVVLALDKMRVGLFASIDTQEDEGEE